MKPNANELKIKVDSLIWHQGYEGITANNLRKSIHLVIDEVSRKNEPTFFDVIDNSPWYEQLFFFMLLMAVVSLVLRQFKK